jgi:hypothetical protein
VDAVLGLSVTPSAVGLVLVEGQDADGATVDREAFEIPRRRRSTAAEISEEAAAAVLRTEATAATRGQRLHSIGVTWSDDADHEASLLMRSLTERGFQNVVPVQLPEATEALAWGVAEVIGQDVTAVCVIEPATVMALIVHTCEGAVQTAVNHTIDSEEALVAWLSAVFTRADWRPEALVMVGSGGEVDALMPRLEEVLSVPVFAPSDAELALARGAALASAQSTDFTFADIDPPARSEKPSRPSRWRSGQAGPLAMLVAGAVTFVVSASVAVSLEVTPKKETASPDPRPAAKSSPGVAAAADSVPLAPPRAAATASLTDAPSAPPPQEWSPELPVNLAPPPTEAPVGVVDSSAGPVAIPVDGAPPEAAPVPPPPDAPVDAAAPQVPAALPPPPPVERPSIRQRIKDRLSGINRSDDVPVEQMPPADAPPPDPAIATTSETPAPPPDAPPVLPPS